MAYRRFGAFSSSENPEQLGMTVRGAIMGLSTVVIFLASKAFSIELTPENLSQFATSTGVVVTQFMIVYGLLKKFSIFLIDKWNRRNDEIVNAKFEPDSQ